MSVRVVRWDTGQEAEIPEEALRWGLALGISRFQGYFIDKLVSAIAAQYQKK